MSKRTPRAWWGTVLLALLVGGPPVRAAEDGSVVVCFELHVPNEDHEPSGKVDVHIERLTPDGKKAWGRKSRGATVAAADIVECSPAVCADGAGGAIVVYVADRSSGEGPPRSRLVAQRMGPDGKRLWVEEERAPIVAGRKGVNSYPVLWADGKGGAFLAYVWKSETAHPGVFVQRIDPNGKPVWNVAGGGLLVSPAPGLDRHPVLVPDGAGGVIVVFELALRKPDFAVCAQRVSRDGTLMWEGGEIPVVVCNTKHRERRPAAIPDGEGGMIAVFQLERETGKYAGNVDLVAQRLSPAGKRLWGGERPCVFVSTRPGQEGPPVVVSDGAGGALVVYDYERKDDEAPGDFDVVAQRVSPEGKPLWTPIGSAVAASMSVERSPVAVPTIDGGMIVVLEYEPREGPNAGNCGVVAQRMSADGKRLWNEGKRSSPVFMKEYPEHSPLALADGRGGVVVVASANAPPSGQAKNVLVLLAQRLDGDGALTWQGGAGPAAVGAALGPDLHPCAVRLAGP